MIQRVVLTSLCAAHTSAACGDFCLRKKEHLLHRFGLLFICVIITKRKRKTKRFDISFLSRMLAAVKKKWRELGDVIIIGCNFCLLFSAYSTLQVRDFLAIMM